MNLYSYLQSSFPDSDITHKPKGHYDIYETDWFRLFITPVGEQLRISFLRATPHKLKRGRRVVQTLRAYCHEAGMILIASHPDDRRKRFWRKCGFTPMTEPKLWMHEDWRES